MDSSADRVTVSRSVFSFARLSFCSSDAICRFLSLISSSSSRKNCLFATYRRSVEQNVYEHWCQPAYLKRHTGIPEFRRDPLQPVHQTSYRSPADRMDCPIRNYAANQTDVADNAATPCLQLYSVHAVHSRKEK